jgi:TDG/mug DNA glycosylase family protein
VGVPAKSIELVDLPMVLAGVRRTVEPGDEVSVSIGMRDYEEARVRTVVEAAALDLVTLEAGRPVRSGPRKGAVPVDLVAIARRALPDHVGPGMRLLCCGLNPSLHAADAGVGYVTGSNRFWPALIAAGLTDRPRDNIHLLTVHHIGMTDIVKRPTPRADELRVAEYREGVERLASLCDWLRPGAVVTVGLAGWRAAVDRTAAVGWQPDGLGAAATPVYVMPSTSGLNARVSVAQLADHLAAAARGRS